MPKVSAADRKILDTARSRLKMAMDATSSSRQSELDDLRFMAASPDNQWQWPQEVLNTRGAVQGQTINARPCLTINKLPQHVKQVTNDQRQNRPAGKVIPVDDKADVQVAEIINGMVRHIEYISDADVAYDTACENQVTYGEGYIRILTEYCDENSFDQDIKIGRIRNSFSVYMDPLIQDPAGCDAQWCLITCDMLKEDFEAQFPNATPISTWMQEGVGNQEMAAWFTDKTVRVADYYYCENEQAKLCLFEDQSGEQIAVIDGTPQYKIMMDRALLGQARKVRERPTVVKKIRYCKLNGFEVLERRDWPGKWIPVVRVVGNEFEIEGELYLSGIIRNAKDAQRMYNYWTSQEAEMLALAPKAPFIGYAGQFEGYEQQWKTANINNWPYLEVNTDVTDMDGKVLPLPQRAPPPLPQAGLIQAKMGAADDIKGTTGQYDPSLGAESSEKSGRAIIARERQSDTGTYHYVDNLAKAIRFVTRQIIDLIPKIYDVPRIARIVKVDGEIDHVKIDPTMNVPMMEKKDENGAILERIYNPSLGKYDVMATTGPSYMTKRQEAMNAMGQLLQSNPQLWGVAGDLFIKNMDWPGAQEMAKRFAKTIPPEIRDEQESPELAQANKVIEGLQQQLGVVTGMLKHVEESIEAQEVRIKGYEAETKRMVAVQPAMSADEIKRIVLKTMGEVMTSQAMQ